MNDNKEIFILRKSPLFEIVLNEDSFEINNTDYTFNNGIYRFEEILSFEFLASKIDWFPTILGNLLSVFGGSLGREKTDDRFIFHFISGKNMEVKLINSNKNVVNEIMNELKQKIHS